MSEPNTLKETAVEVIEGCLLHTDYRGAWAKSGAASISAALERAGYVVVKVDEPLSEEEFKSLLGITDLMRGVQHPQEPYTSEPGKED